ncbi:Chromate reductase [Pectobacterium versatile]|nr:Chromate reductase [Pectobacterium versatile]POY64639.1 Chromate reductase [Pectobacterium versatile]
MAIIMNKILILNGSNSVPEESINGLLASEVATKFSRHEVCQVSLHDLPLPMYQLGHENDVLPDTVSQLGQIVRDCTALVIVSPEHNGLMPACLKNAIDWLSRIREQGESFFGIHGKKVLLLSTSPGQNGGATNLKYMGELMPWWGCEVAGTYSVGDFYKKYQNGSFDTETDTALQVLVSQFESQL